mgnify:CR=1 FL=1
MPSTIASLPLLVDDCGQAIHFHTQALRFDLIEDTPLSPGKRWVRVAPAGRGTRVAVLTN